MYILHEREIINHLFDHDVGAENLLMPDHKYMEHALITRGSICLPWTYNPLKVEVSRVCLHIWLKEWPDNGKKSLSVRICLIFEKEEPSCRGLLIVIINSLPIFWSTYKYLFVLLYLSNNKFELKYNCSNKNTNCFLGVLQIQF